MDAWFLHANNEDSDQTANEQADLNLRWAHMSEGTFSDIWAHIVPFVSAYELWFKQMLYEINSVRDIFMHPVCK